MSCTSGICNLSIVLIIGRFIQVCFTLVANNLRVGASGISPILQCISRVYYMYIYVYLESFTLEYLK